MFDDEDTVDELPAPPRIDILEADRKLLELAARSIGATFAEVDGEGYGNLHFDDGSTVHSWNPLQFSGDALELAVRGRLGINAGSWTSITFLGHGSAFFDGKIPGVVEEHGDSALAATRRAIVRAAAEIGMRVE